MTDKATRATVQIGSLTVDGFMLPDGSYRMSQTQAAECVNLRVQNISDFLRSNAFKSLVGEGYTAPISEIEPEEDQQRGSSRIRALPLDVVAKYWVWQCYRGNKAALALVVALVSESLERRFDTAFGVNRTEQDWNARLAQEVQQLERDLTRLGEAYAMEDEVVSQLAYLERWLQERGLNPWNPLEEE